MIEMPITFDTLSTELDNRLRGAYDHAEKVRTSIIEAVIVPSLDTLIAGNVSKIVHTLATLEGRAEVYATAAQIVKSGQDAGVEVERAVAELRVWMMRTLLQGADDSWSGRGNDLIRSKHDGVRDALTRLDQFLNALASHS